MRWLQDPHNRHRMAGWLFWSTLVAAPTSFFMPGGWQLPLTLCLSWLAITLTAADIYATTDVRKQQEK